MDSKQRRDSKMQLLLHDAVSENDIAQVKFYFKFQPSHSQINRASPADSLTPLLRACKHGYIEIARILLDNGAMVEDRDEQGNTCLHYAAKDNNTELVRLLLNCCARTFVKNSNGQLPIDIADGGSSEIISDKMLKDGRHEFVGVCKMLNLSNSRLVMSSYHQNKPTMDANENVVNNNERTLSDRLNWKRGTCWDLPQESCISNKETSVANTKTHSFDLGLFQATVGNPQKPRDVQPFTNGNAIHIERREIHKSPVDVGFAHDVRPINGVIKPTTSDQTHSHLKGDQLVCKNNNIAGNMNAKRALSCHPESASEAYSEVKENAYNGTLNGHSFQRKSNYNCSSKLQNGSVKTPPSSPPPKLPLKPNNLTILHETTNGLHSIPQSYCEPRSHGRLARKTQSLPPNATMQPKELVIVRSKTVDGRREVPRMPRAYIDAPRACIDAPRACIDIPRTCINAPLARTDVPRTCIDAPLARTDVPRTCIDAPRACIDAYSQNGYGGIAKSSQSKEFAIARPNKTINGGYAIQRTSCGYSENRLDIYALSHPKSPSTSFSRKPIPPPKPIGLGLK